MDLEIVLRQGLLGLSVFACGVLIYSAQLRSFVYYRDRQIEDVAYAMLDVGTSMVLFAVVESILIKIPRVPLTVSSVLYFMGLALIITGGAGVAVGLRRSANKERRDREATDHPGA